MSPEVPDVLLAWDDATRAAFLGLVTRLSNWGRWGPDDELGTANLLTAERALDASRLVRHGRCVPLGRRITTRPSPDNPRPMVHFMTSSGDGPAVGGGSHASDWLGLSYHGFSVTHIDAVSHQFYDGLMYNGRSASLVTTSAGAGAGSVEPLAATGLVGRGVLLDVPAGAGRSWWDPGEAITPADLDRAASWQRLELRAGDVVLVRTGRDARAREHGVCDPVRDGSPGLAVSCLEWLSGRDVAVLGSDVQSDVMRPGGAPHPMPIHAGALAFLGLPLLDNLALEGLAAACAELAQWEFMVSIAPLSLQRATGSPVNPLAVL